jgi:asparagine synthase (glutamine-hydrolysing)
MSLIFGFFDLEKRLIPNQVHQLFTRAQADSKNEFHYLSGAHFFLARSGNEGDTINNGPLVSEDGRYYGAIDARLDGVDLLVDKLRKHNASLSEEHSHNSLAFKAYLLFGEDCTSHLQGDFALVIYDSLKKEIWCSRDHLGISPLFYSVIDSTLIFAQLPPIVASVVNSPINFSYIASYLVFTDSGVNETAFKAVSSLPAGHNLKLSSSGLSVSSYYSVNEVKENGALSYNEAATKLLGLMTKSVRERLRNAKHPSTMLSGGLDSSTVTCLAAKELAKNKERLQTYTYVPMDGKTYPVLPGVFINEGPYAFKVKEMYKNIDCSLVDLKGVSIFPVLEKHLKYSGSLEVNNFYNWLWSQEFLKSCKASGSKVLFSGQMGNLSISYNGRLYGLELVRKGRWKEFVQYELKTKDLKGYGAIKYLTYRMFCAVAPSKLRAFVDTHLSRLGGHSYNWMVKDSFLQRNDLNKRSFLVANSVFKADLPLRKKMTSFIQKLAVHSKTYEQVYGVKELDPTADRQLIEYSLTIPSKYWSYKGQNRALTREMTKGLLPDSLRLNNKKGRQLVDSNHLIMQDLGEIKRRIASWKKHPQLEEIFEFDKVLSALDSLALNLNKYDPDLSTFLSRMIAVCLLVEMNSDGAN